MSVKYFENIEIKPESENEFFSLKSGFIFGTSRRIRDFYDKVSLQIQSEFYESDSIIQSLKEIINYSDFSYEDVKDTFCQDDCLFVCNGFSDSSERNSKNLIKDMFYSVSAGVLERKLDDFFYENKDTLSRCLVIDVLSEGKENYSRGQVAELKNRACIKYRNYKRAFHKTIERFKYLVTGREQAKVIKENEERELARLEKQKAIEIATKKQMLDIEQQYLLLTQQILKEQNVETKKSQMAQAEFYMKQLEKMKALMEGMQ